MSSSKTNFSDLSDQVITKNYCVGCGACVSVCPAKVIDFIDAPKLIGKCIECGLCFENCPIPNFDEKEFEEKIFGRIKKDSEINCGITIGEYAIRAVSTEVLTNCQDGGAATSLLLQALKEGFTGALVVDKDINWNPKPLLVSTPAEIINAAGTKYSSAPILKSLKEINQKQNNKLVIIGTPCQIRVSRQIEYGRLNKSRIGEAIKLRLGLFCMETFNYDTLTNFLIEQGIDPKNIVKFEIKKGKFIVKLLDKEPYEIKISKMKPFVRKCCNTCIDFASEFADISIGNVGSPEGYSTVLIRTKEGEALLKKATQEGLIEVKSLNDFTPGLEFVKKLASEKKKRSANLN
ncbi:4Fe-4S dicluster domain-containing protein [Candidatus Bathyarchaeota archaeon]|nr:4Fe-4S dicluster domain-containing protein [Candidatus Bathyarchaeota archaeon]